MADQNKADAQGKGSTENEQSGMGNYRMGVTGGGSNAQPNTGRAEEGGASSEQGTGGSSGGETQGSETGTPGGAGRRD